MFYYLCKLSLKMLTEWKKEMLLIMVGTVICSCAVIKFTDNITNFEHFYYDAKGTKEEQVFYENRVHFSFPDAEKLPEAVERLKGLLVWREWENFSISLFLLPGIPKSILMMSTL